MDPYQRKKQDPHQHQSQNSGVVEAKKWSHGGPWTLAMEARRIKMERIPRPEVGDSHHIDGKQNPDPDQSVKERSGSAALL